jgi:hypothetical protein
MSPNEILFCDMEKIKLLILQSGGNLPLGGFAEVVGGGEVVVGCST